MDLRLKNRLLSHQLWIVAIAATVFFINLGAPRLWDRDEPRNAGCALEMLQRNDWVVPVFNAELRTHKPVLLYWFMIAAYRAFGENEFAARFWSAVLGVGTVLVTYHIGRRVFDDEVGFWGALVLTTTLMFAVAARAATPDSVLIFFTTLAMAVYVFGTFPKREGGRDTNQALPQTEMRVQWSGFRVQGSGSESKGRTPSPETRTLNPEPRTPQNLTRLQQLSEAKCPNPVNSSEWTGRWYPGRWSVIALMYAVMGIAVLAKGPVGLVLPTATIGMFLLIMRRSGRDAADRSASRPWWLRYPQRMLRPFAPLHFLRTCWFMRPVTALAAVSAVALPWYIWVGLRTNGAWLEGFFMEHHLHRAAHPMEGHDGPIFYYLVAICIGFFPWSIFFGPASLDAAGRIRANHPWKPGVILMACWAGVYIGIFSLARTKLPNYITPAYPAVALLTGAFLHSYRRHAAPSPAVLPKVGLAIMTLVGVAMLVGLPLAAHRYLPGDEWLALVGLVPLLGGIVGLMLAARSQARHAVTALAVTSALFVTAMIGLVPVRVDRHQKSDVLLDAIAARSSDPCIASLGRLEPSWVFYARHHITQLPRQDAQAAASFLTNHQDAFLITTETWYERIREGLPGHIGVVAKAPAFLDDEQLVLIAAKPQSRVATRIPARPPAR